MSSRGWLPRLREHLTWLIIGVAAPAVQGGLLVWCHPHSYGPLKVATLLATPAILLAAHRAPRLVFLATLPCLYMGTAAGLIAGMDYVAAQARLQNKPAITDVSVILAKNDLVDTAADVASGLNVLPVVAAGNARRDIAYYSPASASGGVAIAASHTDELYRRLLRLHLEPAFGRQYVNTISPAKVRTWRAERRTATGATTTAKSYRLLKAIMQTTVEDELIRRNPCSIRGAGREDADEWPVATIDQVFALAEAIGIRWRLMVLLGAFASMRPEELAELRRGDIDLDTGSVRVRRAAPELNTGRRGIGDPKSRAGKREIMLPGFVLLDVRRHLDWYAQPGPEGLVFVGEKGAALRGTTFGRKWRKARDAVGMPKEFRFYDLRHTGNTLAADTGAKLNDLMVRAGQSSERAQLIYQHSTKAHQRTLADNIDADVRRQRAEPGRQAGGGTAATVHTLVLRLPGPGGAARRR
ncbi:tyrosine-type recombinase/integrase [Streptomyces sp. PvR034]|uniref:tyrosine-type recombinase/integrase n=1 Tax=Streptomyces sp. PvR034 TaxID=3156401 RepID=UPI00339B46E0